MNNDLKYICRVFDVQLKDVAEHLGITKQAVNEWVNKDKLIPRKHIQKLSKFFDIPEHYFMKGLTDVEKLEIQKLKIEKDSKPVLINKKIQYSIDERDLIEEPFYDNEALNEIMLNIKKAKVLEQFKEVINRIDDVDLLLVEQVVKLFQTNINDPVFVNTIDTLSHYFGILEDWVGNGIIEEEFEKELIQIFEKFKKLLK